MVELVESVREHYFAIGQILREILNSYQWFIEQKNEKRIKEKKRGKVNIPTKKELIIDEVINKMNTQLSYTKDRFLININKLLDHIKNKIILNELCNYILKLEEVLKNHLQIMSLMGRKQFQISIKYEISKIEVTKYINLLMTHTIHLGRVITQELNLKYNENNEMEKAEQKVNLEPNLLDKEINFNMQIVGADGELRIGEPIELRKSELPKSIGKMGGLADIQLKDRDLADIQFQIVRTQEPKDAIAIICESCAHLTLFKVPGYPWKTKLIADNIIYLGCSQFSLKVNFCSIVGNNIRKSEYNIDPWINYEIQQEFGEPSICLTNQKTGDAYLYTPTNPCYYRIGRGKEQDIQIFDDGISKIVSNEHCRVGYDDKMGWYISENDYPSKNGTYLALKLGASFREHSPPFLIPLGTAKFVAGNHAFQVICETLYYT